MSKILGLALLLVGSLFAQRPIGPASTPGSPASGPGSGTVTSIATAKCVSGGPITTTGTISLGITINPQTSTYQVLAADFMVCNTITVASGTFTITLVASGSQPANGQNITIVNYGSGVVTVARSGQNINGGTSSLTLPEASATVPTSAQIWSDGTNYFANLTGVSGVPTTRAVNTTSPLGGGGSLSSDLTLTCTTCGVTGSPLSQFASTTSTQLAGVISDETGSGLLVYGTSPTLVTPAFTTNTTLTQNSIGAAIADGDIKTNTTAATNNAQQWSPAIRLTGQYWNTTASASKTGDIILYNLPQQGTTSIAGSAFVVASQNDGGGYTTLLQASKLGGFSGLGTPTLWFGQATPSASNYFVGLSGTTTFINGTGDIDFSINNGAVIGGFTSSSVNIITVPIKYSFGNTTGAGTALLGSNSPAVTNTAPYTWLTMKSSDGSTVYVPTWK